VGDARTVSGKLVYGTGWSEAEVAKALEALGAATERLGSKLQK